MTQATNVINHALRRRTYYWLSLSTSYGFPIAYYGAKLGFTKASTSVALPILLMTLLAIIRISMDIPTWVRTWKPSFLKGMLRAIPVLLVFIILVTLGLTFKYMLDNQVQISFAPYFETVFVLFGGQSVGAVLNAVHLKHKEIDMMSKGYVLGTINK